MDSGAVGWGSRALDAKLGGRMPTEFDLEIGSTLICVTPDQVEAATRADRRGVLNHGREVKFGATHLRAVVPAHIGIKVEEQVRFG